MAALKSKTSSLITLVTLLGLFIQGCGRSTANDPSISAESTSCQPGAAEILVADGFIQILCGCTGPGETSGRIYPTPGGLTCLLPTSSSVVYFFFLTNRTFHQIVPTDVNSFVPSPIMDPENNAIKSYAVTFPRPATTYGFLDPFSAGIRGTITVP